MKATKKPVTIDAIYYNGSNAEKVLRFCEGNAVKNEDGTLTIHTLEGDHTAIVTDYIIRGVKGEYCPCKEEIFEQTYDIVDEAKIETFNFGKALELLKEGKKVCRSGWNGKGMFLTLQGGSVVTGTMMRNKPAKDFYGDGEVKICPHIDMKAADGSYVVGWLASQTDMLADDWMEA